MYIKVLIYLVIVWDLKGLFILGEWFSFFCIGFIKNLSLNVMFSYFFLKKYFFMYMSYVNILLCFVCKYVYGFFVEICLWWGYG